VAATTPRWAVPAVRHLVVRLAGRSAALDAPGRRACVDVAPRLLLQVTQLDFNHEGRLLASCGGLVNTVWDFSAPQGPAGTMPTICFGHAKTLTCQVGGWAWFARACRAEPRSSGTAAAAARPALVRLLPRCWAVLGGAGVPRPPPGGCASSAWLLPAGLAARVIGAAGHGRAGRPRVDA